MEKLITSVHETAACGQPGGQENCSIFFSGFGCGPPPKAVEISYALPQGRARLGQNRGFVTVRQLAAAAGDGPLGFAGSPGQLETSLNSG